jgi:DNA adenine methylase
VVGDRYSVLLPAADRRPYNPADMRPGPLRRRHISPRRRSAPAPRARSAPPTTENRKPETENSKPEPPPRPFLKWAGGKTQLLPELERRVPACFGDYHEPFVGSGALFFRLRALGRIRRARLSDLNEDLIECYVIVRDQVEELIAALTRLRKRTDRAGFYEIREQRPAELSPVERAARLIYLNKTCYNGLYRVNRAGKFNVPFGRYKNPNVCDAANLRACSAALKDVEIERSPFQAVLRHAKAGDFVYFDPPYVPVSQTAHFTAYYRDGFDEGRQRALAEAARALSERGCRVLLSNSDTPLVHRLYRGFSVERVGARRAINSVPGGRGEVAEVVVAGGREPFTPV